MYDIFRIVPAKPRRCCIPAKKLASKHKHFFMPRQTPDPKARRKAVPPLEVPWKIHDIVEFGFRNVTAYKFKIDFAFGFRNGFRNGFQKGKFFHQSGPHGAIRKP